MAVFPKIQSPCPYRDRLAAIMDGDVCRMCHRQVHDLTAMDDAARLAFLKACEGEVCISYRAPARIALAAMAVSAAVAIPVAAAACPPTEVMIVVGGMRDPTHTELVQDKHDAAIPALPVVVEEAPAKTPAAALPRAAPVSSRSGS